MKTQYLDKQTSQEESKILNFHIEHKELTNKMERNASCCRVLIKASFTKFKFNPSSDFLLATTSSTSAAGNKKIVITYS